MLPQVAIFFFGRNLYYSWFVNDSCRPHSFLDDPNNPSLVTFLFLYVFTIGRCLLPW